MKYELFTRLYGEALEYSDVDLYIAERAWQDWMDDYENVGDVLKAIYQLAHSTLKETREKLKISRAEFSRKYNIPVRTLENWDAAKSEAPSYVKVLIDYTIFSDSDYADYLSFTLHEGMEDFRSKFVDEMKGIVLPTLTGTPNDVKQAEEIRDMFLGTPKGFNHYRNVLENATTSELSDHEVMMKKMEGYGADGLYVALNVTDAEKVTRYLSPFIGKGFKHE